MKTHHSSATSSFSRQRLFCAIVAGMTLASQAHAGPSGGQVVDGLGSISNVGKETTILQDSHRLAINWDSFNIAADERVEFIQPGSQSLALNRIIGNDGSQILGRLDANGHVILVNPNGIIFGENATVNVGGLVASGLDIKPTDFMNGDLVFKQRGNKEGLVINQGLINAASGGGEWPGGSHGNVVLLGKRVANEGLISATLGSVTLAAGREAVLTFDPQGLIGVRVTKETLQNKLGLEPAVNNSGTINAASGRVLLSASASQDVFSQAVNSGDLAGNTDVLIHDDGSFSLGKGANLVNTGDINVSGHTYDAGGGKVVLLGEDVQHSGTVHANGQLGGAGQVTLASSGRTWLQDGSSIDTNGLDSRGGRSGGEVALLGRQVGLTGDAAVIGSSITLGAQGQGRGSRLRDTDYVLIGEDTLLDAVGSDAGSITSWSRLSTLAEGQMNVWSRFEGGRVELASRGVLGFTGQAQLGGAEENGTLLLQGRNLSVTAEDNFATISAQSLEYAMQSGGSVALRSNGNLRVSDLSLNIEDSYRASNLALFSTKTVSIEDSQIDMQAGALNIRAGADILAPESVLAVPELAAFAGNDITLVIDASTQAAQLQAAGNVDLWLDALNTRPSLQVKGEDVNIFSYGGFDSQIEAQNLTISQFSGEETITADVAVAGNIHIEGAGQFTIHGDLNTLSADTSYYTGLTIIDRNDLMLGNMQLSDSSVTVTSTGEGATISQLPGTSIKVGYSTLELEADNIELGADGTSELEMIFLADTFVRFDDSLTLNGLIHDGGIEIGYQDYQSNFHAYGSDRGAVVNVGQSASFQLPSGSGIELGSGSDTLNLSADLPVAVTLGDGADTINLLAPDISYNFVDFNEDTDTLNPYAP